VQQLVISVFTSKPSSASAAQAALDSVTSQLAAININS
jgi:hypothetical protein